MRMAHEIPFFIFSPSHEEKNMRRIFLFMNVSLDGYFEGPGHDISGFHSDFEAFSSEQSQEVDTILFGHKTYEMMKFWSTPQAEETAPEIAKFMNERPKFVASHQYFEPGWKGVTVISGDVPGEVKKLKEQPGKTIAIFGSNSLCVSLIQAGLLDEIQIMLNPVVFGEGTSLFKGLPEKANLTLTGTHQFKSGAVLLTYEPVKR
jgi:dihydrofolate reductase